MKPLQMYWHIVDGKLICRWAEAGQPTCAEDSQPRERAIEERESAMGRAA